MEVNEANLRELASKMGYDPMRVGEKILEALGYTVSSYAFGYNSTRVVVESPSGETVCEYSIGD